MNRAKLAVGALAAFVAVVGLAGNTCTWTAGAGNGSWKADGNWDTKPASFSGDTVILSVKNGVSSLTNDITSGSSAIYLYSLQVKGDAPVTLTGGKVGFNNQNTWIETTVPFVCDAEIGQWQKSYWNYFYLGASATFKKQITLSKEDSALRIVTTAGTGVKVVFDGPLVSTAANTTFALLPKTGDSLWVNNSISAATITPQISGYDSSEKREVHVVGPMDCSLLNVNNCDFYCEADNVLCPTGRIEWVGAQYNGQLELNGHDQTTGPLGGESTYGNDNARILVSSSQATLTIASESSATTYALVRGALNILLDAESSDVVQTFGKRTHDTTGNIDVANGTLKVSEGSKWTNVKKLVVRGAGAAFEVDAANGVENPLPSLHHLRVGAGGLLKLPEGVAIKTHLFYFGNTSFAAGKYSGVAADGVTQTDAIEGAGIVEVVAPSSDYVFWTGGANDGKWSSSGNWSGGTPSASKPVRIAPELYAETISIAAGDVLPSALTIDGALAAVHVTVTGSFAWDPTAVTVNRGGTLEIGTGASITTTKGAWTVNEGEILVSGGTFDANSFGGTFAVKGSDGHEGVFRMTGGLISHKPVNWSESTKLQIQKYGKLQASGGVLRANTAANGHTTIINKGGKMEISGGASYEGVAGYSEAFSFRTTMTDFSGNSSFVNKNQNSKISVVADAGETNVVLFSDHASVSGTGLDSTTIAASGNGRAVFEIDTDTPFSASLGVRILVGVDDKTGEFVFRKGYAATNFRGLIVGGASGSSGNTGASLVSAFGGSGLFRMIGGGMTVGVSNKRVEEGFFPGWSVGEGGQTLADGKGIFTGRAEISGGCLTNLGFTVIGGAHSVGSVEQTGGEVCLKGGDNCPLLLGLAGGTGSYVLGGGCLALDQNAYVGGSFTNIINGGNLLSKAYPYPVEDHTAVGTLTVTGGTLVGTKQIMVGANGAGTINVRGSEAAISCASLILSNTVALATSSTLNFTADANGLAPIEVSGKVVNTPGTTMTVDLTDAPASEKGYKLIGCTSWEGPVPACTFVGSPDPEIHLVARQSGLYAKGRKGIVLVVQ